MFREVAEQSYNLDTRITDYVAYTFTALPTIFIYIPTIIVFITPLLNLEIGPWGNIAIVTIHLYPGTDPLILLILISDFRGALIKTPQKILNATNSVIQKSTTIL
ncbi:hypothetical protein B9Z55_018504 [Caenorhabditis nigoni]|uniref:7TM GPCR serpentine receptor class x (Srx) domain-containing protein n=1 Tax=Caenorhabditis nigoni TaxID=1611254 RepID=A0A2G5TE88_9PELO|nr:hypothetical protein B9Z55_018504 [Caenorhabditis nigoni]